MDENVTRIPLRRRDGTVRAYALIDTDDEELVLSVGSWSFGASGYATCTIYPAHRDLRLHRLLLGLDFGDPRQGDHINRDKLDNRRSNLRIVTQRENCQNPGPRSDGTSAHRGVAWDAEQNKWRAYATIDRRRHWLGRFDDELAAAAVAREFRLANMPGAVD